MKNIGSLKPCHVFSKKSSENVVVFQQKDCWAQILEMLIDEDPYRQVNFVGLFKVTVLFLYVIMMNSEIKLIISGADVF